MPKPAVTTRATSTKLAMVVASVVAATGTVVGAAGATAVGAATTTARTSPATTSFPSGYVDLQGHGLGPGIGMGQWGAFGYAAQYHESYRWILSHFYGGTTMSALSPSDPQVSVAIIENDQAQLVVTSKSRFRIGTTYFAAGSAARAVMSASTGKWTLTKASSCSATASSWTKVATGLTNPTFVPYSQAATAPTTQLLTICRDDGVMDTVRGRVEAHDYTGGSDPAYAETLNLLPLDDYLADVVPSESSVGWGETGAAGPQSEPWGFQELEAQAVAARTYLEAYTVDGGWNGADICDSYYCQSYPGITNEAHLATVAVTDTEGEYLTEKGEPAETEYSASTGGYTTKSQFPAVADAGDAVCITSNYWTCNPEHDWTASIKVSVIDAAFPTIGTLQSITIESRDGLGQWGGRVLTLKLTGTKGSVSESGDSFQWQFGLDSNWFTVVATSSSVAMSSNSSPAGSKGLASPTNPTGTGPLPSNPATDLGTGPLPAKAPERP